MKKKIKLRISGIILFCLYFVFISVFTNVKVLRDMGMSNMVTNIFFSLILALCFIGGIALFIFSFKPFKLAEKAAIESIKTKDNKIVEPIDIKDTETHKNKLTETTPLTNFKVEGDNVPKNSPEIISLVKKLTPEINRIIEEESKDYVRRQLNNIDELRETFNKEKELYKKSRRVKMPSYRIKEFKELERASMLAGEEREDYITKKAQLNMNMFGSCHSKWNHQKKILKEVYGIDWLTPQEEHPEIMFD